MKVFEKILCPVDFSENSAKALLWAEHLSRKFGSELTVLHVLEAYPASVLTDTSNDFENYQKAVHANFRDFAAPLQVPFGTMLSIGEPARKIAALAKLLDSTLIVMGTRGLKGIAHKLLGSVTDHVLRIADVPVMTVSPQCLVARELSTEHLLLPVASLDYPPRGYVRLRKIIRELDASVSVLHVVDFKDPMFNSQFDANPFLVTTYQTVEKKEQLAGLGAKITRKMVDALIRFGDPATEILKETETHRCGYVMMAVHRKTLLSGFLETTAYEVISRSSVPVITVRKNS